MARLNLAREFGVWRDDGGHQFVTQDNIMLLKDGDIDEQAIVVNSIALPNCRGGTWAGGEYTYNIGSIVRNKTFIFDNAWDGYLFNAAGTIRQVGIMAYNSGSVPLVWKVKSLRDDGFGGLDFIGESDLLEIPIESEVRIHEWILSRPFNVNQGDRFAYWFKSDTGNLWLKTPLMISGYPGKWTDGDITWSTRLADYGFHSGNSMKPSGIMAVESAINTAVVHIDLVDQYRSKQIEIFTDKYSYKELVLIETSNNNVDWLEWVDHKFYTRWDSVPDGNDYYTFNGTKGVIYATIDGSPRFYRITLRASCFSNKTYFDICVLNDDSIVDFKPSDFDVTAGNWVGSRSGTISINNQTRVDLTEPFNKDGYVYAVQLYGRVEVEQKLRFYVLRDKGSALEIRAFSDSIDPVEVSATNQVITCTMQYPLKARQGDYLAVKGTSNFFLMYDANATSTTPLNDPSNYGNGVIMGGVTVTNETTKTENWILTVVDDSVPGQAIWEVEGSVSGVQASQAYTGIQYTSEDGEVQFTIQNGATGFRVNDKIYFETVRQGRHWYIPYTSITDQVGSYIPKDSFNQTYKYNIAMKVYQDIFTDEVWCDDADIGAVGDPETIRVYNKGTEAAEAWVNIVDIGDKELVQISTDLVNWYGFQEAGLPIRIHNRINPLQYSIPAGDYGNVYVRTNLPSGIDEKKETRVMVYWKVTI
jgi:hypothetical protein